MFSECLPDLWTEFYFQIVYVFQIMSFIKKNDALVDVQ